MKSKTVVMVMAITLAFGTYAFAGRGYMMMGGHGGMMNQGAYGYPQQNTNFTNGQNPGAYGYPQQNVNLTNEQLQQLYQEQQNFQNAIAGLRQQIYDKNVELRTEFAKADPDPETLAAIQKEISGLQSQIDQKGIAYQIAVQKIAPVTATGGYVGGYGGYPMMGGYGGTGYGCYQGCGCGRGW